MAGLNPDSRLVCQELQACLEERLSQGQALTDAELAHLEACPACRTHWRVLQELQEVLLSQIPAVDPPPELRQRLLDAARPKTVSFPPAPEPPAPEPPVPEPSEQPAVRRISPLGRWWPAALGAAALALGLLFLNPAPSLAQRLPDPAVVVGLDGLLLVASNDAQGTISLIQGERVTATLASGGAQASWFTEGVRLGQRIFLADAANDRVLEVQLRPLRVIQVHRVPDGIAGLTAASDEAGGRVYFKSVQGMVGTLDGPQMTLAQEQGQPLADVMDGVLLAGGTLFVTHHLRGEVCLLDPQTLEVRKRLRVGGMPVSLDHVQGGVLVLDVTGRLLQLDLQGQLVRKWAVGGHPDKLSVSEHTALLTDRSGTVTRIDLRSGQLQRRSVPGHPMDVQALPGGQFAVASAGQGLSVVDRELRDQLQVPQQR